MLSFFYDLDLTDVMNLYSSHLTNNFKYIDRNKTSAEYIIVKQHLQILFLNID